MAERVAAERRERVGGTVGLLTESDQVVCQRSLVVYCTHTWLLRTLLRKPHFLLDCTHVVVDESHEASLELDLLLVMLRRLMKATMDARVAAGCDNAGVQGAAVRAVAGRAPR
jgi:HrpA-like RNA helicase